MRTGSCGGTWPLALTRSTPTLSCIEASSETAEEWSTANLSQNELMSVGSMLAVGNVADDQMV